MDTEAVRIICFNVMDNFNFCNFVAKIIQTHGKQTGVLGISLQ